MTSTKNSHFVSSSMQGSTDLFDSPELQGMVIDEDAEFFDIASLLIIEESFSSETIDTSSQLLIDYSGEISRFLYNGCLQLQTEERAFESHFLSFIPTQKSVDFLRMCFFLVLSNRFPECFRSINKFMGSLASRIQVAYVQLLQSKELPSANPSASSPLHTPLLLSYAYIVNFVFYKYFAAQREFFDIRFVVDTYLIILTQVTGMPVTDLYVQKMLKRYFNPAKFMDYEKSNIKELLQRKALIKKLSNKSFLGFPLQFPSTQPNKSQQNAAFFKQQILSTLKQSRRESILQALLAPEPAVAHKKIESISTNLIMANSSNQNNNINNNRQDTSTISNNDKSTIGNQLGFEKMSLQSYKQKQPTKFNCSSVSPAIAKLLDYRDSNLPFLQRKVINHISQKHVNSPPMFPLSFTPSSKRSSDAGAAALAAAFQSFKPQAAASISSDQQNPRQSQLSQLSSPSTTTTITAGTSVIPKQSTSLQDLQPSRKGVQTLIKDLHELHTLLEQENHEAHIDEKQNIEERAKALLRRPEEDFAAKNAKHRYDMQLLERKKQESGNADIFDMPYTGTKSEARNLIAYVRRKARANLLPNTETTITTTDKVVLPQQPNQTHLLSLPSLRTPHMQLLSSMVTNSNKTVTEISNGFIKSLMDEGRNPQEKQEELTGRGGLIQSTNRKLLSTVIQRRAQGNGKGGGEYDDYESSNNPYGIGESASKGDHMPEYILKRTLDNDFEYTDQRHAYRKKYNGIFEQMDIDQNIHDIKLNIQQKQNLVSHHKKHHKPR